jgi:nucleoid-associated protein YgaU
MNRYQDLSIIKDQNGRRKFTTTFIPYIDKSDNDIYVITDPSDRLDLLANQFYGDSTAWPIIASANSIGLGSLNVESGKQLRIPDPNKLREYTIQLNNFNSQR